MEIKLLTGHDGSVLDIAWDKTGGRLASAGEDGNVRIWDIESGRELHHLDNIAGPVEHVTWNAAGTQLLTSGGEGSAQIWDARTGQELIALGEPGIPVRGSINYDRDYDWFRFRIREERKITAIVFHGLKKCDGELRLLRKIRSGLTQELKRYILHAGDTYRLKGLDLSAGDYFIVVSAPGGGGEEYRLKIDR